MPDTRPMFACASPRYDVSPYANFYRERYGIAGAWVGRDYYADKDGELRVGQTMSACGNPRN